MSKNTLFRKGAPKGPESLECNATDTSSPKDFVQKVLERHFSLYAWATGGRVGRRGERERATREKFENFLRLPKKELLLLRTSGLVEAELATKVSICGLTCGLHHDKPGFYTFAHVLL